MATKKKRTPEELWGALERQALDDEMERIRTAPIEAIDQELRDAGLDPAEVGARGAALAARLLAERDRIGWQIEADAGMVAEQKKVDAIRGRFRDLDRAELMARLEALRGSGQERVTVMFRNKRPEQASDLELRDMLEEATLLADRKPE